MAGRYKKKRNSNKNKNNSKNKSGRSKPRSVTPPAKNKSVASLVVTPADNSVAAAKPAQSALLLRHPPEHPLEHSWDYLFWKANDWQNVHKVYTVSTIENFWGMYNNIYPLTQLENVNFALFLSGTPPIWEHDNNKRGGKWLWAHKQGARQETADIWLTLMLTMIGETLSAESDDEVVGSIVNLRFAGDRMSLWTKSCDRNRQARLGAQLKKNFSGRVACIKFKAHAEALSQYSSYKSDALITL